MFKLLNEALVNRQGTSVQVRTKDGSVVESKSVEANLLFEILNELKKQNK